MKIPVRRGYDFSSNSLCRCPAPLKDHPFLAGASCSACGTLWSFEYLYHVARRGPDPLDPTMTVARWRSP